MDPLLALNLPWDQLHNLSSKQLNAADPLAIHLQYNGPDG